MSIDIRIFASNEYVKHRALAIKQAKFCTAAPWFSEAQKIISEWFFDTLSHDECQGDDEEKIISYIISLNTNELPGHMLIGLTDIPAEASKDVNSILQNGDVRHPEIEWLVGGALADAVFKCPERPEVMIAAWSLLLGDLSTEAFLSQLQASWQDGASLAVTRTCEIIAERIADKPEEYTYRGEREQFARFLKDWPTSRTLFEIWFGRSALHFNFECSAMGLFEVLRRCDKASYLNLLEHTGVPNAIEAAFHHIAVKYDYDEILALLQVAPVCFENKPVKWNGAMSAPYLISIGDGHVREIVETVEQEDRHNGSQTDIPKLEAEIQILFEKLVSSILGRQDGIYLSFSWLCHLIWLCRTYNRRPNQIIDTNAIAISTTAKLISTAWVGLENAKNLYPHFFNMPPKELEKMRVMGIGDLNVLQRPNGTDVFFACAAIHAEGGHTDTEGLLEMLQHLLIRHDYEAHIGLDERYPSLPFHYAARLFLKTDDPVTTWKKIWSQLAEQRRRHRLRWYKTSFLMGPSELIAGIGIAIGYWFVSEHNNNPEEAWRLWEELFEVALQQFIECPTLQREFWRSHIFHLFALLPKMLKNLPTEDTADRIAQKLICLGGDSNLWIGALTSLKLNGSDVRIIDHALRQNHDITLITLISNYADWYKTCLARHETGVIERCKDLIIELEPVDKKKPNS